VKIGFVKDNANPHGTVPVKVKFFQFFLVIRCTSTAVPPSMGGLLVVFVAEERLSHNHGFGGRLSEFIVDTRTRVIDIVIEYEILGRSPDEIIRSHSHLSLYHIHDALSFYYENRDELDQKIKQDQKFIKQLKEKSQYTVNEQ
jgi:uncharacterized protein (DUF433 family)